MKTIIVKRFLSCALILSLFLTGCADTAGSETAGSDSSVSTEAITSGKTNVDPAGQQSTDNSSEGSSASDGLTTEKAGEEGTESDQDKISLGETESEIYQEDHSEEFPEDQRQTISELGISFVAPDGLTAGDFDYTDELYGGVLLNDPENPESKKEDDGTQPAAWITAPGFVGEVHQKLLEFDSDGNPEQLNVPVNHITVTSGPIRVRDTAKPAVLYKMDVNKYTIGYLSEHPELQNEEQDAHRWFVIMASPKDEDTVVLSLDADQYSKDQMIGFAQTVKIDTDVHFFLANELTGILTETKRIRLRLPKMISMNIMRFPSPVKSFFRFRGQNRFWKI